MSENAMGFPELHPAIYAALSGFIISAAVKLTNKLFDRRKEKLEEHVILRKELREELDIVRDDLHRIQSELDEWKEKYYAQVELTNALKLDILKLTEELTEYKNNSGIFPIIDESLNK